MNREALIHWFQEQNIDYSVNRHGIILFTKELSNRTVREIGASNGKLKFGAEIMVVNDE